MGQHEDLEVLDGLGGQRQKRLLEGCRPGSLGSHEHGEERWGRRIPAGPRSGATLIGAYARTNSLIRAAPDACWRTPRSRSCNGEPSWSTAASEGKCWSLIRSGKSFFPISTQPASEVIDCSRPEEKNETWVSSSSPVSVISQRPSRSLAARSKWVTLGTASTRGTPPCPAASELNADRTSGPLVMCSRASIMTRCGQRPVGQSLLDGRHRLSGESEIDDLGLEAPLAQIAEPIGVGIESDVGHPQFAVRCRRSPRSHSPRRRPRRRTRWRTAPPESSTYW